MLVNLHLFSLIGTFSVLAQSMTPVSLRWVHLVKCASYCLACWCTVPRAVCFTHVHLMSIVICLTIFPLSFALHMCKGIHLTWVQCQWKSILTFFFLAAAAAAAAAVSSSPPLIDLNTVARNSNTFIQNTHRLTLSLSHTHTLTHSLASDFI